MCNVCPFALALPQTPATVQAALINYGKRLSLAISLNETFPLAPSAIPLIYS